MPNSPLIPIDLEMPADFPVTSYEAIFLRMVNKKDTHPDSWKQFVGSWNTVAYRFLSCTEYCSKFTDSIICAGNSPPQPERYKQENDLFGFFITGLSTIESLYYGLYAIGSTVNPYKFPITGCDILKNINPQDTAAKFKSAYSRDDFSECLNTKLADQTYNDWRSIRNILVHRSVPGRHFYGGGEQHGEALWIEGIQIDKNTTVSKRDWLAKTLDELLKNADAFTINNL